MSDSKRAPFRINDALPTDGQIIFFGNFDHPTMLPVLVIYEEENDYWKIQQVSHEVARTLSPQEYARAKASAEHNQWHPGLAPRDAAAA